MDLFWAVRWRSCGPERSDARGGGGTSPEMASRGGARRTWPKSAALGSIRCGFGSRMDYAPCVVHLWPERSTGGSGRRAHRRRRPELAGAHRLDRSGARNWGCGFCVRAPNYCRLRQGSCGAKPCYSRVRHGGLAARVAGDRRPATGVAYVPRHRAHKVEGRGRCSPSTGLDVGVTQWCRQ